MHSQELLLLMLLLSPAPPAAEHSIVGTWRATRAVPVADVSSPPPSHAATYAVAPGTGASGKLELTFGAKRCRVRQRRVEASYRCSIRPEGRDAFVVERLDAAQGRRVRRVFHVDGDRMWTVSAANGGTEEFTRVRSR
jgi:hypothetical protein